jgi:hypothetical protein
MLSGEEMGICGIPAGSSRRVRGISYIKGSRWRVTIPIIGTYVSGMIKEERAG